MLELLSPAAPSATDSAAFLPKKQITIKIPTDMKVKLLAAALVLSVSLFIALAAQFSWLCFIPFVASVAITCYIGRHEKELNSDIDELFGRDHELR